MSCQEVEMGHVSDVQLGVAHPIPTGAVILATCASRFWQRPLRTRRAVKTQNPVLLHTAALRTFYTFFFFFLILFVSSKCLIFIELIQCSWLGLVFIFIFLRNIFISIVICKILNKVFSFINVFGSWWGLFFVVVLCLYGMWGHYNIMINVF